MRAHQPPSVGRTEQHKNTHAHTPSADYIIDSGIDALSGFVEPSTSAVAGIYVVRCLSVATPPRACERKNRLSACDLHFLCDNIVSARFAYAQFCRRRRRRCCRRRLTMTGDTFKGKCDK